MSVDDATWGEIRRCYCGGDESVACLAARFGVSVGAVRYRARRDVWVRGGGRAARAARSQRADPRCGDGKTAVVVKDLKRKKSRKKKRLGAIKKTSSATRDEVVERLYLAIVMKLASLEARMESQAEGEASTDAAQSERETRELSTMIRSFEKVTEVAADIAKQSKPKSEAQEYDSNDAERMREEIAERLERLNAQWEASAESDGDGAE